MRAVDDKQTGTSRPDFDGITRPSTAGKKDSLLGSQAFPPKSSDHGHGAGDSSLTIYKEI